MAIPTGDDPRVKRVRSIGTAVLVGGLTFLLGGEMRAQELPERTANSEQDTRLDERQELEQLVTRHDTLEFKAYFTRNVDAAVIPISKILIERMAGVFQRAPKEESLKDRAERVWKFLMPPPEDRFTPAEGTVYLLDVVQRAVDAHYRAMGSVQWADIVYGTKTGSLQRMMNPGDGGYGYVHPGDLGLMTDIRAHERNVINTLLRNERGELIMDVRGREPVPMTERRPAVTVEFLFEGNEYKVLFPILERVSQYAGEIPDGEGTRPYTFGFSPRATLGGAQLVAKDVKAYQRFQEIQAELVGLANDASARRKMKKLEKELKSITVWVQVSDPNAEKPYSAPSPSRRGPGDFCDASCQQPSSGFGTYQPVGGSPP